MQHECWIHAQRAEETDRLVLKFDTNMTLLASYFGTLGVPVVGIAVQKECIPADPILESLVWRLRYNFWFGGKPRLRCNFPGGRY